MFKVIVPEQENFNEETGEFEHVEEVVFEVEHSLFSLSKWESKFEKPFLAQNEKTPEEMLGYLEAMVITPDLDPSIVRSCTQENLKDIQEYIDSAQSATTFGDMPRQRGPGEVITSELIYFWMVCFTIPFECQHWHLNRLFSLIRVCNIKNSKQKKMSRHEVAQRNRELNAQRKAQLNTTG